MRSLLSRSLLPESRRTIHPVIIVNLAYGTILLSLLLVLWSGWRVYRELEQVETEAFRTQRVLLDISRLDEVLTRSARNAVVTGEQRWIDEYASAGREMKAALSALHRTRNALPPDSRVELTRPITELDTGLSAVERAAIRERLATGRPDGGLAILSADGYNRLKDQFGEEIRSVTADASTTIMEAHARLRRRLAWIGGLLAVVLLAGSLLRATTVRALRSFIRSRKQVEEEHASARRAAEEANRAKSDFLSRMSHELRTPLNAILGFGQLLESDPTVEDQESVTHIMGGGRHLLGLIDEILDLATIEAGRISMNIRCISLHDVVSQSVDLVRPLAARKGLSIRWNPGSEKWLVRADIHRLRQVLLNLLSNAIKYNRDGGLVEVTVRPAAEGMLRVEVRDTGPGLSQEDTAKLFTPFERLDAGRTEVQGTGLGLALSRGLIVAMQGQIGVESVPGQGSTFWIELPQDRSAPTDVAEATRPDPPASPEQGPEGRGGQLVLCVEDNPRNLRLIERYLSHRPDVELMVSMTGRLALELARDYRPSLIVLDLNLPDIPGEEVLRSLRNDPELQDVPVVIVSANVHGYSEEALLEAGAQAYLPKPVSREPLLEVLDRHLPERTRS